MTDPVRPTRPITRLRVLAWATLLTFVACAAPTPPPRYHSLLPAPDAAPLPGALSTPGWEPLSVTVPAQADRPEWVVRAADGALAVLDDERWSAPLAAEVGAAIAERLRRAAARTSLPPGRKPWRITVDIERFESQPGRAVRVEAEWSLRPGDGAADGWRCRGAYEQAAEAGYVALAAAHREAMRRLGDAIASGLAAGLTGTAEPVCTAG